ncbi:MAG: WXG100 family type VII secretion target [Clostridia bacterium]|nr:WXG100 family type VII secretion target [Clostridia bacterium]
MSTLYLDLATLQQRADELETMNERLLSEIATLNDTEAALAGMWEGPAKDAFRTAYHNDSVQMKNFYNAVRVYVQVLRAIIMYYRQVECMNRDIAVTRSY